ncbi:MAG TPA: MXAN_5187 C-terminal domain-containing protein [Polyangiales bacterium]|nr:MXAN_5187 C-terminal domain-containing protein [Polyangiales bacterium]
MRLKIIAGNLVAVLLLGLVSYWVVGSDLRQDVTKKISAQIGNDQVLLDRSLRLTALEFVDDVKQRSADPDLRNVFAALDEEGRRTRAYEASERSSQWFQDPARGPRGRPHVVLITDDTGKVIARDQDRNRMYGTRLEGQLPAVRATLGDREARHDVWKKADEAKLLEIAVAVIRGDQGQVVGSLVVGYDLSNGLAQSEGKRLGGRDVAFLVDDQVYSSSLDETVAKQLRTYLYGDAKAVTSAAIGGTVSAPWLAKAGDHEFAGVLAPLPEARSAKVAYAVLADRSEGAKEAAAPTRIILALTLVFSLVVLAYGFMVGNSIVGPIEEIEEGVLAAINGNTDVRLNTGNPDLGGLAYRINQLLNVFTGVQEAAAEDDDEQVPAAGGGDWKDESELADAPAASASGASVASPLPAAPASGAGDPIDDPSLAARLDKEPADAYYKRVYSEYAQAKRTQGESFSVPEDRFTQRLKGNETALAQKHGARGVRFVVQVRDGQVLLQPVLIK